MESVTRNRSLEELTIHENIVFGMEGMRGTGRKGANRRTERAKKRSFPFKELCRGPTYTTLWDT